MAMKNEKCHEFDSKRLPQSMHSLSRTLTTGLSAIKRSGVAAVATGCRRIYGDALSVQPHQSLRTSTPSTARHIISPAMVTPSRQHQRRQYFADINLDCHPKIHNYEVAKCTFATHTRQRSPYVVLQVSANASKNEIKAAFRKVSGK